MGRASQARVNVSENCYNPVCASCRRAEALGYPGRSPPAQAMTDYFFKDHIKSNTTHRSAKASQFSVLGSQSSVLSPHSSLLPDLNPIKPHHQPMHLPDGCLALLTQVTRCIRNKRRTTQFDDNISAF